MKSCAVFAVLLFASASIFAQAIKPCEVLKSEIEKKMEVNGVKSYTLTIVAKVKASEGKVVGTCDGGKSKVVYTKTAPQAPGKK
jgi:hypothetical protein